MYAPPGIVPFLASSHDAASNARRAGEPLEADGVRGEEIEQRLHELRTQCHQC